MEKFWHNGQRIRNEIERRIYHAKKGHNVSPQHLYFVRCNDAVKIGKSRNPKLRAQQIQVSAPGKVELIAVFHGAGYLEKICHNYCRCRRIWGEWFQDDIHVGQLLKALAKELGNE